MTTENAIEVLAALLGQPRTLPEITAYAACNRATSHRIVWAMHARGLLHVHHWVRNAAGHRTEVFALQVSPFAAPDAPIPSLGRNAERETWHNLCNRNVTVVPEWDNFDAFLRDMGPRPSRAHRIKRLDPSKPFGPGNCQWHSISKVTSK